MPIEPATEACDAPHLLSLTTPDHVCGLCADGAEPRHAMKTARSVFRIRPHYRAVSESDTSLRRQRRRVCRDVDQILFRQLGYDRLHQIGPKPRTGAVLHVEHLPRAIARRSPRKTRHRTQALQIDAMTDAARGRLPAARFHERLTLLDASHRHIGNEA